MEDRRPGTAARWAAVLALLALLAAAAVAVLALVHASWWRLAGAVLAVLVSVFGGWYALSRRGPGRLAGLAAAAVGMGGLLAAAVTGEFRGLALAGTVLLVLASSGCASVALNGGKVAEAEVAPAAAPLHPVLILNPKSGGGKAVRYRLADVCRARGIDVVELTPGSDLEELAHKAVSNGADALGMAGGDGSQALVAAVAAEHDVPFVCIPAGTRNHLALDLGIDRDDVVAALDAFAAGTERRVDLATVNGRVFVNNASMGIYARIVQSAAYRDAKLKTATDMLPDLLGPDRAPFDLRFTTPAGEEWPYAHMLLVSNNPYRLDRLVGGGTRPRLDTGRLGMAAARMDGPAAATAFIALEAAGRLGAYEGWEEWSAPTFRVDSSGPVEIGIDGEATVLDPPLLFESRPGALRVRVAENVPGPTGGAGRPHLGLSTVVALLRTASGRPGR